MSSSNRKKERRLARKEKNREKDRTHKEQAWESGKLIEENHNLQPYTAEYTIALTERLVLKLTNSLNLCNTVDEFVRSFREYKNKIRDLIIYWSPDVPESSFGYNFLKLSLELYWDRDQRICEILMHQINNDNY